jgi:hypothetical protein
VIVKVTNWGLWYQTGHATPFIYADAGGRTSTSVGEYSATTVSNLGNPSDGEEIYIMSFAQSNISDVIDPARIEPTLRRCVASLNNFSNPRDIVTSWLNYSPSAFLGAAMPDLRHVFDYANQLAFAQLLGALTRFGFAA